MQIVDAAQFEMSRVVNTLRQGGLVIYPTETCYGLAALATSEQGVSKLLQFKQRPSGKAIAIAVNGVAMAEEYVAVNPEIVSIFQRFLPGPLTVIGKSLGKSDYRLETEQGTLGLRYSSHAIPNQIITDLNAPITATAANLSGGAIPYSISKLLEALPADKRELIDIIIDAGELPKMPPSTVVDTTQLGLPVSRIGNVDLGKMMIEEQVNDPESMLILANRLIKQWQIPAVILLEGPLGAGKTEFVRNLMRSLGYQLPVKSPTYTYINAYKFENWNIKHLDLWRADIKDVPSIMTDALVDKPNLICLEWGSRVEDLLGELRQYNQYTIYLVRINYQDDNARNVVISQY